MIIGFLHWIFGYVCFELYSECPEKFINLSVKNKYHLWDMKITQNVLKAKTLKCEYDLLVPYVSKSGGQIEVKKETGMPFIIKKHKKRIGFLSGVLIFCAIIYVFSLYVWRISVIGCNNISQQCVIDALKELNICPGKLVSSVDVPLANQQIMEKIDDIAWVSINIKGSNVQVNIKEKAQKPEILKPGEPCNIVALNDAQIFRLETYAGTPAVKPDEIVTKGQILVSGVVENPNIGENHFVSSEAKVFAQTKYIIKKSVPEVSVITQDTGKIKHTFGVTFFGKEIPLWFVNGDISKYRCEKKQKQASFLGLTLPVGVFKKNWIEQQIYEIKLSEEQAKNELVKLIEQQQKNDFSNKNQIEIKSCEWGQIIKANGEYSLSAEYICVEDIGVKEKIILEE